MARPPLVCVLIVLVALCGNHAAEASRWLMQSSEPCNCPKTIWPVCSKDGTFVANNWCIAVKCKQAHPGTVAHRHCPTPDSTNQQQATGVLVGQQQTQTMTRQTQTTQQTTQTTQFEAAVTEREPAMCRCNKMLRPVCLEDGEEVAANMCIATRCLKIEEDKLFECDTLKAELGDTLITGDEIVMGEEDEAGNEEEEGWACSTHFDPVCFKNGTMAGTNSCFASHNPDAESEEYKSEWCLSQDKRVVEVPPPEEEEDSVVCTAEFNPQCAEDGSPVGSNPCKASHNKKFEGVPYSNEWCKQGMTASKPVVVDVALDGNSVDHAMPLDEDEEEYEDVEDYEEEDPDIVCTDEFNPQCAEDGSPVGSNPCRASHNKVFEGVPYSSEWCQHGAAARKPVMDVAPDGNSADNAMPLDEDEEEYEYDEDEYDEDYEEEDYEEEDPVIVCTDEFNPQCTDDGTLVGSNPCKAAQNKTIEGAPYRKEWCFSPVASKPSVIAEITGVSTAGDSLSAEPKPLFDNPLLAAFTSLPTLTLPNGAEVPCCLLHLDPVCTKDHAVVHISRACADCDPQVPPTSFSFNYHEDWCPQEIRTREPIPEPEDYEDYSYEDYDEAEEKTKHCLCPLIWNPYCDDSGEIKAGNLCEAECKGLDMAVVSMDKCNHDEEEADEEGTTDTPPEMPNGASARLDEPILREESPIAEIFAEAEEEQVAAQEELEKFEEEDEEPEEPVKKPFCICPLIWDRVCTEDHVQVGANKCDAECNGHAEGTYSSEWCEVEDNDYVADTPDTPRVDDYNTPDTPRVDDYNTPDTPRVDDYNTPDTPYVDDYDTPDTPRVDDYDTPDTPRVDDYDTPDTPRVDDYDTPNTPRWEDVNIDTPRGNDYAPNTPRVYDYGADAQAEGETEAWTDEPCKCPRLRRPVCGPDGAEVAPNRCVAECSGMKPAVDFARSWCPRDMVGNNGDGAIGLSRCNCPDTWEPVCYQDDLSYVSANSCYAECYAHADSRRPLIPCPELG